MGIQVDQLEQVTAGRCTSCMSCVDACPKNRSGAIAWGPPLGLGNRWSQAVLILIMLACTSVAVGASYLFPMPSFVKSRGTPPAEVATVDLQIEGLQCRGRGNLFFWFLERDDMYRLPGYLRVEAWPSPEVARVRVAYDPSQTDQLAIKQAITEPYYEVLTDYWRMSPFQVVGYDPLAAPPPGFEIGPDMPDDPLGLPGGPLVPEQGAAEQAPGGARLLDGLPPMDHDRPRSDPPPQAD
jgi:ferredoxin